jgi:GYF domain 2
MNVQVRKNDQERGPYTESELRERLKAGTLSGSDLGQIEGESDWKPLSEILLASVLATDNRAAVPAHIPAPIARHPWLRDPKVIGSAIVLLLLIFGGINWLNKASEKRHEDAVAARQAAAMEQAQKQEITMLQQQQDQAAKARQAQLDQVKQMMAMTEKAQRDYQEKQKSEQEERQKAAQAKINAEQQQKQEVTKQADQRRLAAEAKQKEQEAEFLKNRPKPAAAPASAAAPATAPSITLTSMPLGPLPKERERMLFSDDRTRIFVIATEGSRTQAIVDGVLGPLCRKVRWQYQRESLGAASWSNNVRVAGPPPFSPDKKRVAYIMELDNDKEAVVIDGVQSPVYDKVGWLGFGPNGHHVAYIAVIRGPPVQPGRRRTATVTMVDNGKVGPTFDDIAKAIYLREGDVTAAENVRFSADGEHLAYVGTRESPQRSLHRVVVDGRAEPREYGEIRELQISRDGGHCAYITRTYIQNNMGGGVEEYRAVLDKSEGPGFPQIEKLVFSEDGSRCAYVTKDQSGDIAAVVDKGVKGPQFAVVTEIVVSENGQRLAYIASRERYGKQAIVVDNGKQSVPYDKCESLKVSSDGSLLSFIADSSQGKLLVVNGQEFGPFHSVDSNVTYSADGKHWICSVAATSSSESGQFLTDGEMHPIPKAARYTGFSAFEYRPDKGGWFAKGLNCELEIQSATEETKIPSQIVYSRDGKHVARNFPNTLEGTHSSEQVLLDDQPVGKSYHRIRDLRVSDDGKHIAYATSVGDSNRGGGLVVFDGDEGSEHFGIYDLVMSPDGKHIAYSVEDRNKDNALWHVVVDGFSGPEFDYQMNYDLASNKFNPDGSLTFVASMKGQLARYTYSTEALKLMPTMGQMGSVTAGLRVLHDFGGPDNVERDLVLGPNETLYGLQARGGEHSRGALFSCKTGGSDFKILHSFYGDKESPPNSVAADSENMWGLAGSSVFRYDIRKGEYQVLSSEHHLSGLRGILPDGSLLGEQSDGTSEYHWWMLSPDGKSLEKTESRNAPRKIAAIGPDGAIYFTDSDSLYRQASFYSSPIVVHKFVDSPEEGTQPSPHITFDPNGTIYGFTNDFRPNTYSIIYSVNRDGSDFHVIVKQSEHFKIDALAAGDNGFLYGLHLGAAGRQDLIFFSVPATGGPITALPGFTDNRYAHELIYHKTGIYTATTRSLLRVQAPSASGAARLNPVVTIKTVAVPALALAEPVSFTTSSGEAIPAAKAPDDRAGAAIWQPPPPGSTTVTISKQTPPRGQNTSSTGANPPNANFRSAALSTGALSPQEASQFAMNTVSAMSAGDMSTLASFYASQVDYQDKGIITNDALQSEFQQYFARWPQTNWQLAGTVTVQPAEGSRCQITFPVSFEAANPVTNKRSTGIARETMTLEQNESGAWKIVRERQTITSRKAEDRGRREREKVYEGKPIDRPNLPVPPNIPWIPGLPHP